MLRWRVAVKAGFGTVARLEDSTTNEERATLYALATLDGWGEEWQRIAAEVRNASLRIAASNGAKIDDDAYKDARDMEYFRDRNNPDESLPEEATLAEWAAAEQMLKGLAGF